MVQRCPPGASASRAKSRLTPPCPADLTGAWRCRAARPCRQQAACRTTAGLPRGAQRQARRAEDADGLQNQAVPGSRPNAAPGSAAQHSPSSGPQLPHLSNWTNENSWLSVGRLPETPGRCQHLRVRKGLRQAAESRPPACRLWPHSEAPRRQEPQFEQRLPGLEELKATSFFTQN